MTVLHPALRKLWWMNTKARFRRMYRASRTLRGALLTAFSVLLFCLWIGNIFFVRLQTERASIPAELFEWMPIAMLAFLVLSFASGMGERSIVFSPSEIEFLFPAPFARRELVLYKLIVGLTGFLFMALIFAVFMWLPNASFFRVTAAMFLTITFIQWFNTAATVTLEGIAMRAYTGTRVAVIGLLLAAVAPVAWKVIQAAMEVDSFEELKLDVHSPLLTAVSAPFRIFTNALVAGSWIDAAPWLAAGVVVDLFVLAVIVRMDATNEDVLVAASQAHYERLKRFKSGNWGKFQKAKTGRLALPAIPRLFGAGPIVRRQLLTALRAPMIRYIGIVAVVGGVIAGVTPVPQEDHDMLLVWMGIGGLSYVTFIFAQSMRYDFRGDFEMFDYLKTLPIPPLTIAAAQICAISVVVFMLQTIAVLTESLVTGSYTRMLPILVAMAPITMLFFGIENAAFLLFPMRFSGVMQGDFHATAKHTVLFLGKGIVLLIVGGVVAGIGAAVYFLADSFLAAFIAGWVILFAAACGMIFLTAMIYEGSDPSTIRAE